MMRAFPYSSIEPLRAALLCPLLAYRSLWVVLCFALLVPLSTYAQGEPKPADIRVLIDVSGSMKQNDPRNLRRPAMDLLIQLFPDGSRAGVWTFGKYVNMLVSHKPVTGKWRKQAAQQSQLINSVALHTNIGAALSKANYDANATDAGQWNKNVILLTDGVVDIDRDPVKNRRERERILGPILKAYKKAGIRIHTVALSTNADADLLERLSLETDGTFAVAEDADALNRAFLRAFDQSAPGDQVPLEGNRFLIDSSVEEFTALVFRKPGAQATTLLAPDSSIYNSTSNDSQLRWFSSDQYDLITMSQPVEGEWSIQADMDPENRVTVVSDLRLQLDALPKNAFIGDVVSVNASLLEDRQRITRKDFLDLMQVTASSSWDNEPPAEKVELSYHATEGSVYQYDINSLVRAGLYTLTVEVNGKTFQRKQSHTIAVRPILSQSIETEEQEGQIGVRLSALDAERTNANLVVKARLVKPDGNSDTVTLLSHVPGKWEHDWYDLSSGDYRVETVVSGTFANGQAINERLPVESVSITVPGKPAPKPVEPEPAPVVDPEPEPEPEKETVSDEEPAVDEEPKEGGQSWLLYALLAGGNLVLLLLGFIAYKLILGGDKSEAVAEADGDEAVTAAAAATVAVEAAAEETTDEAIEEATEAAAADSAESSLPEEAASAEPAIEDEAIIDLDTMLGTDQPAATEEVSAAEDDTSPEPEPEPEPEAIDPEAEDDLERQMREAMEQEGQETQEQASADEAIDPEAEDDLERQMREVMEQEGQETQEQASADEAIDPEAEDDLERQMREAMEQEGQETQEQASADEAIDPEAEDDLERQMREAMEQEAQESQAQAPAESEAVDPDAEDDLERQMREAMEEEAQKASVNDDALADIPVPDDIDLDAMLEDSATSSSSPLDDEIDVSIDLEDEFDLSKPLDDASADNKKDS